MDGLKVGPKLSRFSGDGNPEVWVFQAEQYFQFYKILPEYQLSVASFYLDGDALEWYRWLFRNKQLVDWTHFVEKLLIHYRIHNRDSRDKCFTLHRQPTIVRQTTTNPSTVVASPLLDLLRKMDENISLMRRHLDNIQNSMSASTQTFTSTQGCSDGAEFPQKAEEVADSVTNSDLLQGYSIPVVDSKFQPLLDTPIGRSSPTSPFALLEISNGCIRLYQLESKNKEEERARGHARKMFAKIPDREVDLKIDATDKTNPAANETQALSEAFQSFSAVRSESSGLITFDNQLRCMSFIIIDYFSELAQAALLFLLHRFPPNHVRLDFPFDPGSCFLTSFRGLSFFDRTTYVSLDIIQFDGGLNKKLTQGRRGAFDVIIDELYNTPTTIPVVKFDPVVSHPAVTRVFDNSFQRLDIEFRRPFRISCRGQAYEVLNEWENYPDLDCICGTHTHFKRVIAMHTSMSLFDVSTMEVGVHSQTNEFATNRERYFLHNLVVKSFKDEVNINNAINHVFMLKIICKAIAWELQASLFKGQFLELIYTYDPFISHSYSAKYLSSLDASKGQEFGIATVLIPWLLIATVLIPWLPAQHRLQHLGMNASENCGLKVMTEEFGSYLIEYYFKRMPSAQYYGFCKISHSVFSINLLNILEFALFSTIIDFCLGAKYKSGYSKHCDVAMTLAYDYFREVFALLSVDCFRELEFDIISFEAWMEVYLLFALVGVSVFVQASRDDATLMVVIPIAGLLELIAPILVVIQDWHIFFFHFTSWAVCGGYQQNIGINTQFCLLLELPDELLKEVIIELILTENLTRSMSIDNVLNDVHSAIDVMVLGVHSFWNGALKLDQVTVVIEAYPPKPSLLGFLHLNLEDKVLIEGGSNVMNGPELILAHGSVKESSWALRDDQPNVLGFNWDPG